jgi:hypothetical protein
MLNSRKLDNLDRQDQDVDYYSDMMRSPARSAKVFTRLMWDERRQQMNLNKLARANQRDLTHVKKLERYYADKLKKLNEAKSFYSTQASFYQYSQQLSVESFVSSENSLPQKINMNPRAHTTLGFAKANYANLNTIKAAPIEPKNQNLLKNRTEAFLIEHNDTQLGRTNIKSVKFSNNNSLRSLHESSNNRLQSKSSFNLRSLMPRNKN